MKMIKAPWSWILFFILILSLTTFACQFGGVLEATPTPRANDEDDEDAPPPEEDEDAQLAPTPEPVVEDDSSDPVESVPIERLQMATVLILAQQVTNNRMQTIWTGSGTILTADGIILTNAHVAAPTSPGLATLYNDPELLFSDELDQIVISMVETADQLPEERYIAELRAADGPLDLAVLEIVSDINGNTVTNLDLPFVELGNSDDIRLGDEIRVLGYPGAGGSTITFTRGNVSGFEGQDFVGERAWIKTDSTISPGNSGGLGVNEAGQIIGVPSFVREAKGGAINRMRSINYALPLLEAVVAERSYTSPYVVEGDGNETFELVTWADDFDAETECAIGDRVSYPSNSTALVAIFSFKGMSPGEQLLAVWWLGDELYYTEVFTWSGVERGNCTAVYVHNYGDPLPDGEYTVELYAGGELLFAGFAQTEIAGSGNVASTNGDNNNAGSGSKAEGIILDGFISDADSGQPIEEAVVFILTPGTDVDSWIDDPQEDQILTFAETNREGYFIIPVELSRNVNYPGVAAHEKYFPNSGFLEFTTDDPSPFTLVLDLSK